MLLFAKFSRCRSSFVDALMQFPCGWFCDCLFRRIKSLWFRLGGYALLASPLLLLKYAGLFAVGESVFLRQVVLKLMSFRSMARVGYFP